MLTINYTPTGSTISTTKSIRINASLNDVEQSQEGWMYTNSSDLELVEDNLMQYVGMRFNMLNIPKEAVITNAYLQFTTDELNSETATITIKGEAADNSTTFSTSVKNISNRTLTNAFVTWSPEPWTVISQAGTAQQSPNLSSIIQEIVNRPGYSTASSVTLVAYGTSGVRVANSYDYYPGSAPKLYVTYATSSGNTPINALKSSKTIEKEVVIEQPKLVTAYPIPFSNSLTINTYRDEPALYELIDIVTQQVVLRGITSGSVETINTSSIKAKIYLLKVKLDNKTQTIKVCKQ